MLFATSRETLSMRLYHAGLQAGWEEAMPHSDSEWLQAWEQFFSSIGEVIRAKTPLLTTPKRTLGVTASALITNIVAAAPVAVSAINQFKDPTRTFLEDALYDELRAISQANQNSVVNPSATVLDQASEDSETGKKSLEDLLSAWIPDWLKKALKLLNEILKLTRGS
jgi:hypothetical protein